MTWIVTTQFANMTFSRLLGTLKTIYLSNLLIKILRISEPKFLRSHKIWYTLNREKPLTKKNVRLGTCRGGYMTERLKRLSKELFLRFLHLLSTILTQARSQLMIKLKTVTSHQWLSLLQTNKCLWTSRLKPVSALHSQNKKTTRTPFWKLLSQYLPKF